MTNISVKEWKTQMEELVKDFQFVSDIEALEKMVEEAKKIREEMLNG